MIGTDHIHVCSDGETFAGVLEVVELDIEMVEWSMECEGPCGLGGDS